MSPKIQLDSFRRAFENALGYPRDPRVVEEFFEYLSRRIIHSVKNQKWSIRLTSMMRPEEEILAGARLATTCAWLTTRTYKNHQILPAVVAAGKRVLESSHQCLSPSWIIRFPRPLEFNLSVSDQTEQIAQLADSRSSIVIVDTSGKAWGIADSWNQSIDYMSFGLGGYAFLTNRLGHLEFLCCGDTRCYFDCFDWKVGKETEALEGVGLWIATYGTTAEEGNYERSISFENIVKTISHKRLSSIIALCTPKHFLRLRNSGIIRPLRPDLEGAHWPPFEVPPRGLVNILRLDGIHFLSPEIQVLAISQRLVSGSYKDIANTRIGTEAARLLSVLLGHNAVVIKVSTDGLIMVFKGGKLIKSRDQLK